MMNTMNVRFGVGDECWCRIQLECMECQRSDRSALCGQVLVVIPAWWLAWRGQTSLPEDQAPELIVVAIRVKRLIEMSLEK
jgi:hypothetical protein